MSFQVNTTNEDKIKVLDALQFRHKGQQYAIKKRDLLEELYGHEAAKDESYNNMYDRKLRATIEALVKDGHPICSSASRGYWYAASLKDGLASVTENKSRALTQLHNVEQLEENIQNIYGGQLGMFQ